MSFTHSGTNNDPDICIILYSHTKNTPQLAAVGLKTPLRAGVGFWCGNLFVLTILSLFAFPTIVGFTLVIGCGQTTNPVAIPEISPWVFVDGNTANGINKDKTKSVDHPQLTVFNEKLYAAWNENNGTAWQVRVAVGQ